MSEPACGPWIEFGDESLPPEGVPVLCKYLGGFCVATRWGFRKLWSDDWLGYITPSHWATITEATAEHAEAPRLKRT